MLLIDRWDNEFDNMNNGREGGGTSYKYPNSFVQLLDWLYERAYFLFCSLINLIEFIVYPS